MELIYLWCDNYNNIYNQGFVLNPKYSVSYNNKVVKIKDVDKYSQPDNFFAKNINLMGIIGKNGTGKSTIVKLIFKLFFSKYYKSKLIKLQKINNKINNKIECLENERPTESRIKKIAILKNELFSLNEKMAKYSKLNESFFQDIMLDNTFLIFKVNEKFFIYDFRDKENDIIIHLNDKKISFFSEFEDNTINIHINYMIDSWFDNKEDYWLKDIYEEIFISSPCILEPKKFEHVGKFYNKAPRRIIDLEYIEYQNKHRLLKLYELISKNPLITSFFSPNKIIIKINKYKIISMIESSIRGVNKDKSKLIKQLDEVIEKKDLKTLNNIFLIYEILLLDNSLLDKTYSVKEEIKSMLRRKYTLNTISNEFYKNYIKGLEINFLSYIIDASLKDNHILVDLIDSSIFYYEVIEKIKNKKLFINSLDKKIDINNILGIINYLPPWVEVEFYDNEKSYSSLSSGEKNFFNTIVNILYFIKKFDYESSSKMLNLFLDEIELGMHPQWQKEYLNQILNAINELKLEINVNIYVLSHSPFIVSDIPRENMIFLNFFKESDFNVNDINKEKYIGKCKNCTSEIKWNTFGANIYSLLKDNFFTEGMLIGSFSENKIESIINKHKEILLEKESLSNEFKNKVINNLKEFKYIMSCIGDEYLSRVIGNHILEIKNLLNINENNFDEIDLLIKKFGKQEILNRIELKDDKN